MLKFATFAAAAVLTIAAALPASAAATHNQTGDRDKSSSTSSHDNNTNPYNPNCFKTAVTHVVRCDPPRKVSSPSKDCYCSEIRVRTKAGTIVKKVRCSEFRVLDIVQVRIVTDNCDTIRKLPRIKLH